VDTTDNMAAHLMAAALGKSHAIQADNTALRAESASLRADYMQLQQNFARVEDFLHGAFAPQFMCARSWAFANAKTINGAVRQRLPVGSPGLVAIDIWAMVAGVGRLRFTRETGADFGPEIVLKPSGQGWVRAQLERPLAGLAEDVFVELETDFGLGLSQKTPLDPLRASGANAPLAMRIWKGLPGVRLPNMAPGPPRHIIPVSALPDPEVSGGRVRRLREREAFSLHPGVDGKMTLVFRGIGIDAPANVAAFAQNFGPETVTLSLGAGGGPAARPVYLPAESHVQVDLDIARAGVFDLYFSLVAPSPVASVYIRGLEICPVTG